MTSLTRYLARMGLFLLAVLAVVLFKINVLVGAFASNPGLNALILVVLLVGIGWNIYLVAQLRPEVRWVARLFKSREGITALPPPKLLGPMAQTLTNCQTRSGKLLIADQTTTSLLDSLSSRLEEGRQVSRYLTQLLIFLGLLGTFYGLILTMRSIADVIGNMNLATNDLLVMFNTVKGGLVHPLQGMATAFSASMFGLASALVLGFLDLTAGQAQTRFFNQFEEWLAAHTRPATAFSKEESHTTVTDVTNINVEGNTATEGLVQLQEAMVNWLPRVQDFMRLNTENVTLLQQNMGALRTLLREAEAGRRQNHEAIVALTSAVERLSHETASAPLLQQIERQLAALRDDMKHNHHHAERHWQALSAALNRQQEQPRGRAD